MRWRFILPVAALVVAAALVFALRRSAPPAQLAGSAPPASATLRPTATVPAPTRTPTAAVPTPTRRHTAVPSRSVDISRAKAGAAHAPSHRQIEPAQTPPAGSPRSLPALPSATATASPTQAAAEATQPTAPNHTAPAPTPSPSPPQASPTPGPNTPSATVDIPRLGVQAPVYERGIDANRQLPIAPGYAVTHYLFSAPLGARGNYVIYGHDDIEGSIFHYLPDMQVGDRIYLSADGRRYTYRVTGSSVVSPNDVAVMNPTSNATITLISCTPYMVDTQRIVVKGSLVVSS